MTLEREISDLVLLPSVAATDVFPLSREGLSRAASAQVLGNFIIALVTDSAPATLDTLNELAAALGDDPNFATTVTSALATKASLTGSETLTNKTLTAPTLNSPTINTPFGEFLRPHIHGLTLSNNASDATNDIDIAAGSAASDGATPFLMTLASGLTKRLDAAWAAGNGNGGWLDGASMPDGTAHAFFMQRSDNGAVDVGFSASTSPTLPTNYNRKRRLGSIIRESGAIVAFKQDGDLFLRARTTVRTSTAALASSLLACRVPTGLNLRPLLVNDLRLSASSADVSVSMGSGSAGSADRIVQVVTTGAATSHLHEDLVHIDKFTTDTSGQIYYAATISTGSIALNALYCDGWIDTRGRLG